MSKEKPKAFSLRIDPVLFAQYEADAKKNFRSINQHLEAVLTNAMDMKLDGDRLRRRFEAKDRAQGSM